MGGAPTNAGTGGTGVATATGPTTGDTTGGASQDPAPPATSPATASPATACVTQVYGQLTLAQRVGQLFLVAPTADIAGSGTQIGAIEVPLRVHPAS